MDKSKVLKDVKIEADENGVVSKSAPIKDQPCNPASFLTMSALDGMSHVDCKKEFVKVYRELASLKLKYGLMEEKVAALEANQEGLPAVPPVRAPQANDAVKYLQILAEMERAHDEHVAELDAVYRDCMLRQKEVFKKEKEDLKKMMSDMQMSHNKLLTEIADNANAASLSLKRIVGATAKYVESE